MIKMAKTDAISRENVTDGGATDVFVEAGYTPASATAIVGIDATMQRIRRGFVKRQFVTDVLAQMDGGIDMAQLDVLSAVSHWHAETCEDAEREVTVGTIAERLGVDPSRASRLVSEVVDKGYIRREASQADSRRIVLVATEKGWAFGEEFRRRKGDMLAKALKGWTEDELVLFNRLLDRYSRWGKDGLKSAASASSE